MTSKYIVFKVKHPASDEVRLVSTASAPYDLRRIKTATREVFDMNDKDEFDFLLSDEDGRNVTISTTQELVNFVNTYGSGFAKDWTLCLQFNRDMKKRTQSNSNNYPSDDLKAADANVNNFKAIVDELQTCVGEVAGNAVKKAVETVAQANHTLLQTMDDLGKSHFDIICDGCYTPMRGPRYRCGTCHDFDLCSTCKSRVSHDSTHKFKYIEGKDTAPITPSRNKNEIVDIQQPIYTFDYRSSEQQNIYICDICDADIVGIRHTCGSCPDFDLCHSCFAIVKDNHPAQHKFVTRLVGAQVVPRFEKQAVKGKSMETTKRDLEKQTCLSSPDSTVPTATIKHLGVICDHCDSYIEGIRYKCGHCIDFDLCEKCEQQSQEIHDKTHAFIKIRYPIQSLGRRIVLPAFKPIGNKRNSIRLNNAKMMEEIRLEEPDNISSQEIIKQPEDLIIARSTQSSREASPHLSSETLTPASSVVLNAKFISNLNIPDGTIVAPKKTFIKMWKVKNTGNGEWPLGSHLLFNGGSILRPYPISRPDCFAVPVVSPDDEVCVTAELQAPDAPGEYISFFCLCAPDGQRFGENLRCCIRVDEDLEPEKRHQELPLPEPSTITSSTSLSSIASRYSSRSFEITPTTSTVYQNRINVTTHINSHAHTVDSADSQSQCSSNSYDGLDKSEREEFTTSPTTSTTIRTYTDSQISSLPPSEIDFTDDADNEEDFSSDDKEGHTASKEGKDKPTGSHNEDVVDDDDDFVFINNNDYGDNDNNRIGKPAFADDVSCNKAVAEDKTYNQQLLYLREMGLVSRTEDEKRLLTLLKQHEGDLDKVILNLL